MGALCAPRCAEYDAATMEEPGEESSQPTADGSGDSPPVEVDDLDELDDGPEDEGNLTDSSSDSGEEDEPPVSDRTTLVIGVVMALVAVALVGVLIATGGDDSGDVATGAGDSEARATTAVFGTTDEFERADASELGALTADRDWDPIAGVWGIENGNARVVTSAENRNHAVIGLGEADGAVQVRVERVTAGAGIVFRFRGPFNHWAVLAAPNGSTWNLVKVEDAESTIIGNTGATTVADGTTVAARFEGERVEVIINGAVLLTVQDDFLSDQGKVGLTVRGDDATEARFDDFVAALSGNRPLFVSQPDAEPSESTTPTTAAPDGG